MQLLIVHDDAEVGEQLMTMVKEYTSHRCDLLESDAAAYRWAEKYQRCDLLLVQLQGREIDGFALSGDLSEPFPGLQTFFFPTYRGARERIEIAKTKVFPEPIDGERLLEALEEVEKRGAGPDLFDVRDIIQMCCLSEQHGAVQLVEKTRSGIVYLRTGQIVHVESTITGREALQQMLNWGSVEFAFDPAARTQETMCLDWNEIIDMIGRPEERKPDVTQRTEEESKPPPAEPPKKRGFFGLFRRS